MYRFSKILAAFAALTILATLGGCKKADVTEQYAKEDAAGTGYGTAAKSALYIEDFYFLTIGSDKIAVELLAGSAHYHNESNELFPVYTLQNGDSIALKYNAETKKVESATYTYSASGDSESFFDLLVNIGIIESPIQETPGSATTEIPGENEIVNMPDLNPSVTPDTPTIDNPTPNTQAVTFASGTYELDKIKDKLSYNMLRSDVTSKIGHPNYFFSHNFAPDSYIIDCYNL